MFKNYIAITILVITLFSFRFNNLYAQNCWSPLGTGVGLDPDSTHSFVQNYVRAFTTYNGALIVGGFFDTAGGVNASNIAAWNGGSWSALGTGFNWNHNLGSPASVLALAVYNNELYAAGQFDSAGSVSINGIAKWDGSNWSLVGLGLPENGYGYYVSSLAVYEGELYAAGYFDSIGGIAANGIAKWDGTSWANVSSGLRTNAVINCLATYNGNLYAGGSFDSAGVVGANNIAQWNGTSWSALKDGFDAQVVGIAGYGPYLYASGPFGSSGNVLTPGIAQWNDSIWSPIGNGANGLVDYLFSYGGNLMAGGKFTYMDTISASGLASWNGTNWGAVSDWEIIHTISIYAIDTFAGTLYVGGRFDSAGNSGALNIARHACISGINNIDDVAKVLVYPNPSNGSFNLVTENLPGDNIVGVYNLLGEKIYQSKIVAGKLEMNLFNQPCGIYVYKIAGETGIIATGKLEIQ
jgi:hypothetical protein